MGKKRITPITVDGDLNTYRGAGFKKHKKKRLESDVSENGRAGLHAKRKELKSSSGVVRSKRHKPLALKHKRRIAKAVVVLSAVMITALSIFGYGFFMDRTPVADGEYYTVDYELPTDGSSPQSHTGVENIGYMNHALHLNGYWSSVMQSDIAITAAGIDMIQKVETFKKYYDGALISTDITTTPDPKAIVKVNSARQYCAVDNPAVVMWRDSAGGPETYNGMDTEWKTGLPEGMAKKDYRKQRGCTQDEFAVYIINEDTVLSYSEVTDNGDGTYSQTFSLNPETEPAENSAIYYYRYQMKASGGLTSLPTFDYINVTYTFDGNWRVLSSEIEESYVASMGPVNAKGLAHSKTVYSYEEADAQNSIYRDFFKQYETSFGAPQKEGLTAMGCLASAFGSVLTDKVTLKADVSVDGTPLSGLVTLDINNTDIRVDLGNIGLQISKEDGKIMVYAAYGDLKVKAAIPQAGEGSGVKTVAAEVEEPSGGFDVNSLMEQLTGGTFTENEDKTGATLEAVLDFNGLLNSDAVDLKIPLKFTFLADEEGNVTLGGVHTDLTLLGGNITADLGFAGTEVPKLTEAEAAEYADLGVQANIMPLIGGEAIDISLSYGGALSVQGAVTLNMPANGQKLAVKADLSLGVDGPAMGASVVYEDGVVYLSLKSAKAQPVLVRGGMDDIKAIVSKLLPQDDGGDGGSQTDVLATVLSAVEKLGLGNILNTILTDETFPALFGVKTVTDGQDSSTVITVDGTALLKRFGVDFGLGNAEIVLGGGVSLSALGLNAKITPAQKFAFDAGAYAGAFDVAGLAPLVEEITKISDSGQFGLSGSVSYGGISAQLENLSVKLNKDLDVAASPEVFAHISLGFGETSKDIFLDYGEGGVKLVYDNIGATVKTGDFDGFKSSISALAAAIQSRLSNDSGDGSDGSSDEVSFLNVLLSKLTKKGESIDKLLGALAFRNVGGNLQIDINGVTLTLKNLSAADGQSIFGVDVAATVGGKQLSLSATLEEYNRGQMPKDDDITYYDAASLKDMIDDATALVYSDGATISGKATVSLAYEKDPADISLDIVNLSIGWKDGLSLFLEADVALKKDGAPQKVYFSYGGDGAAVVLGDTGVKLEKEEFGGFTDAVNALYSKIVTELKSGIKDNAAIEKLPEKLTLSALTELIKSLVSDGKEGGNSDSALGGIFSGLTFERTEGGDLSVKTGGIALTLKNDGKGGSVIAADLTYAAADGVTSVKVENLSLSALKAGKLPGGTETYYFDGAALTPLINGLAGVVEDGGMTLSGKITIPVKEKTAEAQPAKAAADPQNNNVVIDIENLSLGWKSESGYGIDLFINANLYLKGESHTVMAAYDGKQVTLVYDNVGTSGLQADTLLGAVRTIVGEISQKAGETLDGILDMLSGAKQDKSSPVTLSTILNIIDSLSLKESGKKLQVAYGEVFTATLENFAGQDGALLGLGFSAGDITGELKVERYRGGKVSGEFQKVDPALLGGLIQNVAEVMKNKGVTLSGTLNLDLNGTAAALKIYSLAIGWEESFKLTLDSRLAVGSSVHDIYAQFDGENLNLVYGDGVGISLDLTKDKNGQMKDIESLKTALLDVVNRVIGVINTISEGNEIDEVTELSALVDMLSGLGGAASGGADILNKLTGIKDFDVISLINGLTFAPSNSGGIISAQFGGMLLDVAYADSKTSLTLSTSAVSAGLEDICLTDKKYMPVNPVTANDTMTCDGLTEVLDYVAVAAEMLSQKSFGFTLKGDILSDDEAYEAQNHVKYNLNVDFDYKQGASGFPLHLDLGDAVDEEGNKIPWGQRNVNFWISPDMYAHLTVDMKATKEEEDSVLFDIYILDANPNIGEDGKTAEGTEKTDDGLDIYMSVGRIANGYTDTNGKEVVKNPVKIYAPVKEIMTVLSAGVAMLDVGDMNISEEINAVLKEVGGVLDTLLVDKYLTYTKDQFSSLGSSLLNTLLGKPVDQTIAELLQKLQQKDDSVTEKIVVPDRKIEGDVEVREGALTGFKVVKGKDQTANQTTLTVQTAQTTANVIKELYADEEQPEVLKTRLIKIDFDTAPGSDGTSYKNFNLEMRYGKDVKAPLTPPAGYYNLTGIDDLLKTLVNAATHKVESSDVISGNPEVKSQYVLNDNFFLKGELNVNLNVIGLVKADLTVNVAGVSVTLDNAFVENGKDDVKSDIWLNVRLHIDKTDATAMWFIPINVIKADTDIDISYGMNSGMLYIKRTTKGDGQTIYRALPGSDFTADIMNHIGFILNFSDSVMNILGKIDMSGNNEVKPKQDYGTQFETYFKSLTSNLTKDSAEWTIVLNGAGLVNYLGDVTVKLGATAEVADGETRYIANSLSLDANMSVANVVDITLSGDKNVFTYSNPQQQWTNDADKETHDDIIKNDPANNVCEWVGGVTPEEMKGIIDWDRLLEETGNRYLEFVLNGENMTSALKYEEVSADFYVKSDIDPASSETLVQSGSLQNVLRNTDTNTVYSKFTYPDISAYERDGYTLVWQAPEYVDGHYKVCAKYMPKLTLKLYSAAPLAGVDAVTGVDGYSGEVYLRTAEMSTGYMLSNAKSAGYTFLGWYYNNPNGGWQKVTNLCKVEGIEKLTEIELHAVWVSATVENCSGTYKSSVILGTAYTLNSASLKVDLYGVESIINSFEISATFKFSAADKSKEKSADGIIKGSGTLSVSNLTTDRTRTSATSGTVTATYTVNFNGVQVGVGTAVADVALTKA